MSAVVLVRIGDRLRFFCPGCELPHEVSVGASGWAWNGSLVAPTFEPSVLVSWRRSDRVLQVCHSHVRGGRIEYCADTNAHLLGGQVVPLPPLPEEHAR